MSNQVPEDSILRRHYEQLQQSAAAAEPAAPEPAPAPASPPPSAAPPPSPMSTGVLSWLKKLFG